MNRKAIRDWRDQYRAGGLKDRVPRYPATRKRRIPDDGGQLIEHARRELRYGAVRTRIWFRRVHQKEYPIATIQKAFVRLGLPRAGKRAPQPWQLRLFEKPNRGDSVQVDVKVVKIHGQKAFQDTALDDCTRFRILRLYRRLNQYSSLDFLAEVRRVLPFAIRRLQCDNGQEFPLAFALTVQAAGMRHRCIVPRCPEPNSKVERSHRIDSEEFWSRL